jgi:hypothetical protein
MVLKRTARVRRDRELILKALNSQPVPNLELIMTEVQRQRDLMGRRVGSAYTRATILIGAAGVLGGASVSGSVGSGFVELGIAGLIFFIIAAVCGLLALRPMDGDEVDVDVAVLNSAGMDEVVLKRSFVISHLDAHADYEESIRNRTAWIRRGFVALGIAWVLATLGATLGVLLPDVPAPTQVVIDKQP